MNVTIESASIDKKEVLTRLMELYRYDFSEYDRSDVDEKGLYGYTYFDHYWTESERFPYLIKVNDYYAGFALIRELVEEDNNDETYHSIAEFFVMKKYRKQGIGKKVATYLFDRFPGNWEVAQMEENREAQSFWRKVIGVYTDNNYQERRVEDWNGPFQTFKSN